MNAPASPGSTSTSAADVAFMDRALELAARGGALTSPNPMVGAVLVRDGKVVGEGFHTYDGVRHAEIIALEAASHGTPEQVTFGIIPSEARNPSLVCAPEERFLASLGMTTP